MKRILLSCMLALALSPSVAWAQGVSQPETLPVEVEGGAIAYDEDKLVEELVRLVQARRATQSVAPVRQTAESGALWGGLTSDKSLMELLRLSMLFDLFAPQTKEAKATTPKTLPALPLTPAKPIVQGTNTATEARLAQLEALLAQLLLRQQGGQTVVVQEPLTRTEERTPQQIVVPSMGSSFAPEHTTDTIRITERDLVLRDFKRSVYFPIGSHKITPQAREVLLETVKILNEYPEVRVRLAGFASPDGNAQANARLAERRLEAVKLFLETEGIALYRLIDDTTAVDKSRIVNELARRVDLSLAL